MAYFVDSSEARREFDLNTHTTAEALVKALDGVEQVPSGDSSNTQLAIDELVDRGFTRANGARTVGHPRVGVLLTASQASPSNGTIAAAERAHDADIAMMVVSIAKNNQQQQQQQQQQPSELEAIASEPVCQHLFLLNNATEMNDLKHTVRRRISQGAFTTRLFTTTITQRELNK